MFLSNHFKKYSAYYIALFIFVFNFLLKYYYVQQESMYGDEGFSVNLCQQPIANIIEYLKGDQNPPLYFIILHYWIKFVGLNLGAIKGLGVIFSSLAAVVLFGFIKRYSNFSIAIFAVALFTFSTAQIYFSREVRCFAMVQLVCILSSWVFINQLNQGNYYKAILLGLLNAILIYSHFLTVFILLIQGLMVLFFFSNHRFKQALVTNITTLILFVPWLKFLKDNIPNAKTFWLAKPVWTDFVWAMQYMHGNKTSWIVFSVLFFLLLIFSFLLLRKSHNKFQYVLLTYFALLYVIPPVGDFYLSSFTPAFQYRYFVYCTIGLICTFALATHILAEQGYKKLAIIISMLILSFNFYDVDIFPPKGDDWNIIVPKVKAAMTPKTMVIISATYKYREFAFYYDKKIFADYENCSALLGKQNIHGGLMQLDEMLDSLDFNRVEKIILVQSHNQVVDPKNKTEQLIFSKGFEKYDEYQKDPKSTFAGVKVSSYIIKNFADSNVAINCSSKIDSEFKNIVKLCKFNPFTQDTIIKIEKTYLLKPDESTLTLSPNENNCEYVDNNKQYGLDFNLNEKQVRCVYSMKGNAEIYLNDTIDSPAIVISIDDKNGNIFYKDFYITQNKKDFYNKWGVMPFLVTLPDDLPNTATFKIYLYAGNIKSKAYLRSLKLDLKLKRE